MAAIDPLTAGAVFLATAATDAGYVMFTSAVVARKRVPAATWSSVWYVLSSYAVISYTENWVMLLLLRSVRGLVPTQRYLPAPPARRPAGGRGAGVDGFGRVRSDLVMRAKRYPSMPVRVADGYRFAPPHPTNERFAHLAAHGCPRFAS